MKKLLIVACIMLAVAFTGGFLTSYFTTTKSTANSGNKQDCGHDEQILALMHQVEIQQNRIAYFTELVTLYQRVLDGFSDIFETQYQWVEELLGQVSYYTELINQANAEIRELEKQIVELQRQLEYYLNPVDLDGLELLDGAIQIESDFWGWGYEVEFALDTSVSLALWNMSLRAYTDLIANGYVEVTFSVDGEALTKSISLYEQVAGDENFEMFFYLLQGQENWSVNIWLVFFDEVEEAREIILHSVVLRTGGEA